MQCLSMSMPFGFGQWSIKVWGRRRIGHAVTHETGTESLCWACVLAQQAVNVDSDDPFSRSASDDMLVDVFQPAEMPLNAANCPISV